jgi:hypothetical protein
MTNKNFIEKYGYDNFDIFKNKSFLVRSFYKGNPVIYIFDYTKEAEPCGFISMNISSKTKELLEINEVPQKDTCILTFNKEEYYKLALKFLEYNITFLRVDNALNVSVATKFSEGREDIIRYTDLKYMSDTNKFIKIEKIKDNWYQRTR